LFLGQQRDGLYGSLRAKEEVEVVEAAERERDWKQESTETSWADGIWHSLL
jgi:hypothetical protein